MKSTASLRELTPLLPLLLAACETQPIPTSVDPGAPEQVLAATPPGGLVEVSVPGLTFDLWPYTGVDFSATPQDPINLIFVGAADPRNVRNALLSVDGTRVGPLSSFDCTWKDAIGGQQTTYAAMSGWSGSVIQLECGDFVPFRFHIRLFPAGELTVANAHVDVLIPGTPDHQVLTWELGETMVMFDLVRSGYLTAAPLQTGTLNAVGSFRTIPPVIYNGLPASLRALTGGPPTNVTDPVGIPTNGSATVLALSEAPTAPGTRQEFTLSFAQFIPKPFCNDGGTELVRVDGPVNLRQVVNVSRSGNLSSQTQIGGNLEVRTFDPTTGQVGPAMAAKVRDHYVATMKDNVWNVSSDRDQRLSIGAGFQRLTERLRVGSNGPDRHQSSERCRE